MNSTIPCPSCGKAIIREQVSIGNGWLHLSKKKIITLYCPLCDWERKKEFKITAEDLELEIKERENRSKIKPPKKTVKVHKYISNTKEPDITLMEGEINDEEIDK